MIKLIQKILYAIIACGIVLGFFPIHPKQKEAPHIPETPEVNADDESTRKKQEDEFHENDDDFDLEEEEDRAEAEEEMTHQQSQPLKRRKMEGDPE